MKKLISIILILILTLSMTSFVYANVPVVWNGQVPPMPKNLNLEAYRPVGYNYDYICGYVDVDGNYQYNIVYTQDPAIIDITNSYPRPSVRLYSTSGWKFMFYREKPNGEVLNVGTSYAGTTRADMVVFGDYNGGTWINNVYQNDGSFRQEHNQMYKMVYGDTTLTHQGNVYYNAAPQPKYNSTITYLLPNDGYADNTYIMSFLLNYKLDLPSNADKNKLKIEVTGGVAGTGEVISHDFKTANNRWEGLIKFTRQLYPGENTITFTLKYDGQYVNSKAIKVLYYDDFIDENEDGIDDRTGQAEVPDEWNKPVPDNTPDGTVLGYIKWAFENITYIFDGIIGLVEGLFKMTGKMSNIIGEYMGGLPSPIDKVLIIGCLAAIILKIFGR